MSLALLGRGCARALPEIPAQPLTMAGSTSSPEVRVEADRLRAALSNKVPEHVNNSGNPDTTWIALAKAAIATAGALIDRSQLLVVVDRNPRVQELCIILAQPAGFAWEIIGGSKVSTGQAGRRGYFITPTGVFLHTSDILDYRAQGTFNENHIRGLGLKGMRVWDFGWQPAERGWRNDGETGEIRLLLHATDPDSLERRLGRPASQGCIRVPASMNRFLDIHGILDADYERAAPYDERITSVLLPDRDPTALAGKILVVIDSSE